MPEHCGTTTTTDDTNIDLHGYSGVESININGVGGRYIISFDKRKTWYTRKLITDSTTEYEWVTINPTNIYTEGMTLETINALTKIDYSPIFQPTQLDVMIAVGILPGETTESYCNSFEVNLPENAAPVISNVSLSHSSIHKGNVVLTADVNDLEQDNISYKIETFAITNLIDSVVGDFNITTDTYYNNILDDDYCLNYTMSKDDNEVIPLSKISKVVINIEEASKVNFYYKLATYSYSYFRFYIDDVCKLNTAGNVDWTLFSSDITAGEHTLKFEYYKSSNTASCATDDNIYIDCLTLDCMPVNRNYALINDWYSPNNYTHTINKTFNTDILVPGKNIIRIYAKDARELETYTDTVVTVTNEKPIVSMSSLNAQRLLVSISDTEEDKIQYQVVLNDEVLIDYADLKDSPINIDYIIPLEKIKYGELNKLVVNYKDSYKTVGAPLVIDFVGKYYGLLFKDESGDYYSDSLGGLLKKLQFDPMFAGQTSLPRKVILENNTGFAVKNVILSCPEELVYNIYPELSIKEDPFDAKNSIVVSSMSIAEEREFFVRIKTSKEAVGNRDFNINAVSDLQ